MGKLAFQRASIPKTGLVIMGILSSIFGLACSEDQGDQSTPGQTSRVDVTAQLNHLLMPIDRGERYEDPLHDALVEMHYGETDGGGTMQLPTGEIKFIDVEIILDNTDLGIPFVIEKLEELGAPKGSILRVHDGDPPREIPFGRFEGIGVYLNGTDLPDEVYANSDVNVVIEELNKDLGDEGQFQSYWEGPTETALYFYGADAEDMNRRIIDFMESYPLCQKARVVTIAPRNTDD